jgi:hypothetical protein
VFYVNDNTGTHPAVVLTQAARFIINGNSFVDKHVGGAAPTAITITNNQAGGGSGSGGVITANNFQAFAVGIQLGAQTGIQQGGIHVSGNNFVATTTSINDLGAGNKIIGQVLNASVAPGSPIPLTSTVTANITSLTLRPGNWMCNGIAEFTGATTTTVGTVTANITNTTAVVGDVPAGYAKTTFSGATPFTSATPITMTLSPINLNVSVDTPVFLNAAAIFAASTMSGYGGMNCVRLQ